MPGLKLIVNVLLGRKRYARISISHVTKQAFLDEVKKVYRFMFWSHFLIPPEANSSLTIYTEITALDNPCFGQRESEMVTRSRARI